MLTEVRNIARADAGIRAGRWPKRFPRPAYDIGGRTVGLIGYGHVARQLASRLLGFEVRLLVYDPYVDAATIASYGGEKVEEMERIFRESDFVSLDARLTDETRRFIRREHFELMKPTAYFINNARSRMVRYDDLYEVLKEGRIAGAALDVHDDEPLGKDSPWRKLENVTLTPHIGGSTISTEENTVRMVAEAVRELV
jgi:D-3-phosphoglycerate dehydrogenase